MTVVVADTSPINYLILVDAFQVLPCLYSRIVVPPEVIDELTDAGTPPAVAAWTANRPDWLEVCAAHTGTSQTDLSELDPGERAAILLAEQIPGALLLIDDAAERQEASRRGIRHTGTLGVLQAAAWAGLVDLHFVLNSLLGTNFRISKALVDQLLAESDAIRPMDA